MSEIILTSEERRAISALQRLAKHWPNTLWLFSAGGSLSVMRCGANGDRVHTERDGMDPGYIVADIDIPNDGGDW